MAKNSLIHTQTQTQVQTQTLSPQQVMVARMLELTAIEMEDKIRSEIIENPALEQIEPENNHIEEQESLNDYAAETANSADDYRNEDDIPDYNGWEYHSYSEKAEDIPVSAATSLKIFISEGGKATPLFTEKHSPLTCPGP